MIPRRSLLLGAVALGLGACGGSGSDPNKPPKISYGSDACSRCHMAIADERQTGAFVRPGQETLKFDDTGELVATVQELGLGDGRVWVHDYETAEWLDGTTATYAWLASGATPMGSGIVAFADNGRAQAFAAENGGWTKSWTEMQTSWTLTTGE